MVLLDNQNPTWDKVVSDFILGQKSLYLTHFMKRVNAHHQIVAGVTEAPESTAFWTMEKLQVLGINNQLVVYLMCLL
jgi:hypothetical protein